MHFYIIGPRLGFEFDSLQLISDSTAHAVCCGNSSLSALLVRSRRSFHCILGCSFTLLFVVLIFLFPLNGLWGQIEILVHILCLFY